MFEHLEQTKVDINFEDGDSILGTDSQEVPVLRR
jgi:hypothetical protein